jgi:hypothetical protein
VETLIDTDGRHMALDWYRRSTYRRAVRPEEVWIIPMILAERAGTAHDPRLPGGN